MPPPRLYPFNGTDQQYIQYLEFHLMNRRWVELMEFPMLLGHRSTHEPSSSDNIQDELQIVQYTPHLPRASSQGSKRAEPYWKKKLHSFTAALLAKSNWSEARKNAGIDTRFKNQLALRLMVGHTNAAAFRSVKGTAVIPDMLPTENQDLVMRGYGYAHFIKQCADDLRFTVSVVSFQSLIFVSYCVVMMQSGISKETTNNMMRRYFVLNSSNSTLEGYRHGVMWVNRCMAALLSNGWGPKSWEVFLLEKRPMAQLALFAANDARSYKKLAQVLGKAEVPLQEAGWIPYCIPCIVQYLAGDNVGLKHICDILGYGQLEKSPIMALSMQFIHSIKGLAGQPVEHLVTNSLA